jgi:hypothetical protein
LKKRKPGYKGISTKSKAIPVPNPEKRKYPAILRSYNIDRKTDN